ncbi:mitochondrial import inner membrane translocase subunit tim54 [Pleurotus ostreatus]|uniref:Mitochondrial import inner membrane translocase subunit TIM54 n=1 Tax=Pleurotus ostreatus TaxID=5322 RepID=A0A8H7A3S9_PLEOS|nr:mitochondrial import inner membrane translocase subunit tim54 [Pleurotus ostreatus]KAF7440229.1 mitochondrial import inner membrane translocase subunit tim54 [Pleurotus ostreatus]KAJ8700487.1 mitochondrial import inner membrane translocase subunit tim54 [Pleurotus ostreatus]
MSTPDADPKPSLKTGSSSSGIRTVLRYTGIPPSWLDKRPKLPSRNWLIFYTVTSSIAGLYIYDRQQCKRIRKGYVERVQYLAEEPINPMDLARKVTVYGAKWPGDEDYDVGIKYFRRFVKPILVAAAVDYEMITGKRHGEIANRVADGIKAHRRVNAGLDPRPEYNMAIPTLKSPEVQRQLELQGGIVLIGRPTFKEFMAGVSRGWTEGLQKVDQEEELAHLLENDGRFDEPEIDEDNVPMTDSASPTSIVPPKSAIFSPLQLQQRAPVPKPETSSSIPDALNAPPVTIPRLPPLLFVPFIDYIGIAQVPLMIWDFFNQRRYVKSGAEAAYRLVKQVTRPIDVPDTVAQPLFADITKEDEGISHGDLDFDKKVESYYKSSTSSIPSDIEKARKKYYDALPAKLAVARALARNERELTKEEVDNPPPTEVELRAERLKKELRWQKDLAGWDIIKPASKVAWDERLRDALRVFIDPPVDEVDIGVSTS